MVQQVEKVVCGSYFVVKCETCGWYTRVDVFHLTAPEVLAQLHALTPIAEAMETPRSVQTLLCTHTCQALIHI